MQFNSAIFVFLFLPITWAVFWVLRRYTPTKLVLSWLVISSLFFYGWWNPIYLGLIILSIGINYMMGLWGDHHSNSKKILTLSVGFNLILLGYFKYFNFFVHNIESISGSDFNAPTIILPLAISFFTFQQIAYHVDVYKHKAVELDFIKYALFVSFFPQLIAGPIVHHKEMMPQMDTVKTNPLRLDGDIFSGLLLFTIGLFKKVIIADALAEFANPLFNADLINYVPTAWESWTATFAYTGQIYFDFSGYCDMAMGLALLFGINLPINFFSPYKSRNISEFWRNWHITLGRFLRDYLYIPLGGNRVGMMAQMRNVIVVMFLGGLWHGANWTFVIWGLVHGAMLAVHAAFTKLTSITIPKPAAMALTFLCVAITWILFRADDLTDAIIILKSLDNFDIARLPDFYDAPFIFTGTELLGLTSFQAFYWLGFAALLAFGFPNSIQIKDKLSTSLSPALKHGVIGLLLATIIILMMINACKETNEFIYFNF